MATFSASVATTGLSLLLIAAAVPAQTPSPSPAQDTAPTAVQEEPAPAQTATVSKVRIVRISEVRGAVQLDRSNGHGYEAAIPNLPVVEQNLLKTGVGVAEVEFEDNSTLRLGPNSEVYFAELGRSSTGATVSVVRVLKGIAYVSLLKQEGKAPANQFDLAFGDRKIPLQPGTHVRLDMSEQNAQLSVLDGAIHADSATGALDVPHKKTAIFALNDQAEPTVGKLVQDSELDGWDKQSMQYHQRVASYSNNFGSSPYSYGLSDMMYYGAFSNFGGCGSMWRPYFASAAWDPYSSGVWAYYANSGYSWVSPYPWGWTPYHYGSWSFCPGTGWGWMPGGMWNGLNNVTALNRLNSTSPKSPNKPRLGGGPKLPTAPAPPKAGTPSLVGHNLTALVHSGAVVGSSDGEGAFVFRKDSAGMGVPRNELGNLHGFSQRAVQRGTAATPVYASIGSHSGMEGPARGVVHGGASSGYAPVAIHRGSTMSSFSGPSSGATSVGGHISGGSSGSSFSSAHVSSTMSAPSSAPVSVSSGGGAHH